MGKKRKAQSPATPGAPRVVAYIRVSTERQVSEGSSLEAQKAHLELYAQLHKLEIVAYEVDAGLSASTLDRPALTSAFARLDAEQATGLLVVKLDRLTRSVRDMAELVERYFTDRYRLMSVNESIDTGTASGRMVLNILTTV